MLYLSIVPSNSNVARGTSLKCVSMMAGTQLTPTSSTFASNSFEAITPLVLLLGPFYFELKNYKFPLVIYSSLHYMNVFTFSD